MALDDGVWTLLGTEPDFSPLDFAQRFVGTISPDGTTIDARRPGPRRIAAATGAGCRTRR